MKKTTEPEIATQPEATAAVATAKRHRRTPEQKLADAVAAIASVRATYLKEIADAEENLKLAHKRLEEANARLARLDKRADA